MRKKVNSLGLIFLAEEITGKNGRAQNVEQPMNAQGLDNLFLPRKRVCDAQGERLKRHEEAFEMSESTTYTCDLCGHTSTMRLERGKFIMESNRTHDFDICADCYARPKTAFQKLWAKIFKKGEL